METEIDLAMVDWQEIPTASLVDCCNEARRQAGAFMPTNGLVVTVFREKQENTREAAAKAIRERNTQFYLNYKPEEEMTPEQRQKIADDFRQLSEELKK